MASKETSQKTSNPESSPVEEPRVFISYAHETPTHKQWVRTLATDLRVKGVNALLDQWKVDAGSDFTLFMEVIRTCDRVLLICTPEYARKANGGEGGVGYERSIVTSELAKSIDTNKFICVLRDGGHMDAIPIFAQSRKYVDFREDAEYEVKLDELLRALHKVPLDPEPPIGPNPFLAAATSERVTTLVAHDLLALPGTGTAEGMVDRAAILLSGKDIAGWKRLVRKTRQEFNTKLLEWKSGIDKEIISKDDKWLIAFDQGVRLSEPLLALALSAIDSEIESLREQIGIIDVILSIEHWDRSGWEYVIEMPRAIAFVAHQLLGTFYLSARLNADAVKLLMTPVRPIGGEKVKPLYTDYELMGFVKSLGGNCVSTWKYFVELYASRPWLQELFSTRSNFMRCYRAYNLIGSIIELAAYLKTNGTIEGIKKQQFWLYVPPMFLHPLDEQGSPFDEILSLGLPPGTTSAIARATGCPLQQIQNAWPAWYQCLLRVFAGCTNHFAAYRLTREEVPPLPE